MSDLISRQKTIKTICFYFEDLIIALPKIVDSDGEKTVDISKINEYLEMYKAIRELITTLPSEKPKTGEWIFATEFSSAGNNRYDDILEFIERQPTITTNKEKNMSEEQWIVIDFKNGETCHYAPDEYTDYQYDGKYFIVIYEKQWIGFYNLDEIRYIEISSIEDAERGNKE